MKIAIIGTGYVGTVTGACLAEIGCEVTFVDTDTKKIDKLRQGEAPFYEPGLNELLQSVAKRVKVTHHIADASDCEVFFICVGTPPTKDGANLEYIFRAAEDIGKVVKLGYATVVIKSTVPPGTCRKVRELLRVHTPATSLVRVVSNPEFLKEGHAIEDFRRPDRIVVGFEGEDTHSGPDTMRELYSHFIRNGHTYLEMGWESAEMTKLTANAMLATRISFINEISMACDALGADVMDVRKGIGTDSRIGMKFLYPGLGYGGSCFPKDLDALIWASSVKGVTLPILEAAQRVNSLIRMNFVNRLQEKYQGDGILLGLLGLSFKPKTSDVRMSAAVSIATHMPHIRFHVYCPEGLLTDVENRPPNMYQYSDMYTAAVGTSGLILATEWAEFRKPDWAALKNFMRSPVVWDGRNQWERKPLEELGFEYHCVGRPSTLSAAGYS